MSNLLNQDFGSDSEDEEFNPGQEVGSDNEDAKPATNRRSSDAQGDDDGSDDGTSKPKARFGLDDDDEDEEEEEAGGKGGDDDDEEDDEEDEDAEEDRPRKRLKRRGQRNQFIDAEAEVDDEEDDEAEDDDEDIVDDLHPDDALDLPVGTEHDDRRHRELDRIREAQQAADVDKEVQRLKAAYGRNTYAGTGTSMVTPQHLLLPSVNDPPIYAVKCKMGKENEVVVTIMKRWSESRRTKKPLQLYSVFSRPDTAMSGYIYIEAQTQQQVMTATEDVPNCYTRNSIQLLPVAERPDLLRLTPPKQIQPEMWVRVKRAGDYAGDLAQVWSIEDNGANVELKLIPRIDYSEDGQTAIGPNGQKRKRPTAQRPPARLFNEQKARAIGGRDFQLGGQGTGFSGKTFTFRNKTYNEGFLIQEYKLRDIIVDNVNPTLEEVARFATKDETGGDNLDLKEIAQSLKGSQAGDYLAGDKVEIYKGEQSGFKGKAVAVRADIVTIEVIEGPMKGQRVEAPVTTLRKLFRDGDHVKVTGGSSKYRDEVGMVVRVKDDRVSLVTDANQDEITVFSKDLRLTDEAGGAPIASLYNLHDLVQLDATTVGVVVKVDKESLRVLDQNGQARTLLPSNISNKLDKRKNAVATDREGSEIRVDDVVKEWMGSQRQGHVMYVHRNYLFIQNRQQVENAGIFVTTSQNVQTVAAKGGRINNVGPDLTKMNPALQQRNGGPNGAAGMPPPRTTGRDHLIGQTVIISMGNYKGLLGIVKDSTDTHAKVEIHSKNKQLMIKREQLKVKDPVTGQDKQIGRGRGGPPMGGSRAPGGPPGGFGRTPLPSRTPGGMATGRTPGGADMWGGSRTPAGASGMSGGRTPAWGRAPADGWGSVGGGGGYNDGGRTSYGGNDGSRTSYGGMDGSRTSYGDGGRTAYGGSGGWGSSRTPYSGSSGFASNDGSKTPAYGGSGGGSWGAASGSRTPAPHNAPTPGGPTPYNSAPTPGAYAAPTPGAAMDGPTPRPGGYGGDYRTPGAMGAPTPGAGYPETPGAFAAETPGAFDEDDGPGYS